MPDAREEFGSYIIHEQLGVGGMASVHVAETRSAGGFRKRVALKRLLAHAAEDPTLVDLFINEARLVRHLHHANIAQTYDFGQIGETYFIAMELVSGPTLGQLLRQTNATIGVIPFPITLSILCQLCEALDYAHKCCDEEGKPLGIIHRDVSPPNVVISNTGFVKLIDFGIAKAKNAHMTTQVGTVKGKFSYIAPEYLDGQLDNRVDLWALGALAYELLTGEQLFDGPDDLTVLQRVKTMDLRPASEKNPEVPFELDAIVLTALERDPDRRWQSAAAMRTALANVAAELQTVITNEQLVQWVEWAFSQQPPGERSELSQLIRILEQPSRPSGRIPDASTPRPQFDLGKKPPAPPRAPEVLATPVPAPTDMPTFVPSRNDARAIVLAPATPGSAEPAAATEASVRRGKTAPPPLAPAAAPASKPAPPPLAPASSSAASTPTSKIRNFSTPRVGAAMVRRNSGGRGRVVLVLVLMLAALAAGAYALNYYDVIPGLEL